MFLVDVPGVGHTDYRRGIIFRDHYPGKGDNEMNILDDLREILTDEDIDEVMAAIGGEMIWIPDFSWFCRRRDIPEKERKQIVQEMVDAYVRRDREIRINKAGQKEDSPDSLPLFGAGSISTSRALGTGQAQSGDKGTVGKEADKGIGRNVPPG